MVRWARTSAILLAAGLSPVLVSCSGTDKSAAVNDGTLLTPYLAIGETLANDEIDDLPKLGAAVVSAAESKQDQPGVDAMLQGAGRIASQDIATARAAFKTMSDGVIRYLRAHPDEQTGHMLVHCTMTFKGKGALWVQKQGKVMNPYEGAMMLHCGDALPWDAELPET
jgi:hypothetical protein